jgi:ferredoxin-2, mitochondrial
MIVNFISADGAKTVQAQAAPGERLLEVAQRNDIPLEGTCEGAMACSTCHVIVSPDWFARLDRASADEEDMLDFASGVTRTSRLACQIVLKDSLDGLELRVPGVVRNMMSR